MKERIPASLRGSNIALTEKTCVVCGDPFRVPSSLSRRYSACSPACTSKARSTTPVERKCEVCGKVMRGAPSLLPTKFCSNDCRLVGLNRLPRKLGVGFFSRQVTAKGYVRGCVWDRGKRRTIMEHRWVMEQSIGRRLKADEVVHHINGDRTDNRLENLELYDSHSAHVNTEHATRKRHRRASTFSK